MKKLILLLSIFIFLIVALPAESANLYWRNCLTGGGDCLDGIDGASLTDGDGAIIIMDNSGTYEGYIYRLEETAVAESSPDVISPDANAGDKRWRLVNIHAIGFTGPLTGAVTGNADTATALAANPSACSAGQYVSDIAADGTLTCANPLDTPTITLADDSTLTLPGAAVDSGWTTGLLGFGPDGTGIFVNIADLEATIPISGEITTEHVACWSVEGGSNLLKACGLKTTDNSTGTHLLCKDDSGEIENCTLSGLAISGTTSPTITVEAVPANATVNAAGEVTIDTTTDQIRWYGTAQQQLSPKLTFSVVVPSVADTDDMLIMKAPYGMTVTALDCIVSAATSATINIQECDSAGANCVDTATSDLACDTDGANTTTLNNAAVDSGDWLKLDVASISGTPGTLTVTVTYTIVAD